MEYSEYIEKQNGVYCSFEKDSQNVVNNIKATITQLFNDKNRDLRILDCACGDGTGLEAFKDMRFTYVVGVDINDNKIKLAKKHGFAVHKKDMHEMSFWRPFDIVYSSHTLEHALYPEKVLDNFYKALVDNGELYIIVPYVDELHKADCHCGSAYLGLDKNDNLETFTSVLKKHGFDVMSHEYRSDREPEVLLKLKKANGI